MAFIVQIKSYSYVKTTMGRVYNRYLHPVGTCLNVLLCSIVVCRYLAVEDTVSSSEVNVNFNTFRQLRHGLFQQRVQPLNRMGNFGMGL